MKKWMGLITLTLLAMAVLLLCGCDGTVNDANGLEYAINQDGSGYVVVSVGNCKKNEIVIPGTLKGLPITAIGEKAFAQCSNLTAIEIPVGVTSIGGGAFYSCTGLTNVTLPAGVTDIGNAAFNGCSSLISIEIPDSVTRIGNAAFYQCSSLASIRIPFGVATINDNTFNGCSALTGIEIPDSVTDIDYQAFYNCTGLVSIKNSEGLKTIGGSAFSGCAALSGVKLPDGITEIGYSAFSGCEGLKRLIIEDLAAWCDVSFADHLSNPLYFARTLYLNDHLVSELSIPSGVSVIGRYAFVFCNTPERIVIPEGVTSIEAYALCNNDKLTSLTLPNSLTAIGSYAFYYCNNLKDIYFNGTQDEWKAISKAATWESVTSCTIRCTDGNIVIKRQ